MRRILIILASLVLAGSVAGCYVYSGPYGFGGGSGQPYWQRGQLLQPALLWLRGRVLRPVIVDKTRDLVPAAPPRQGVLFDPYLTFGDVPIHSQCLAEKAASI